MDVCFWRSQFPVDFFQKPIHWLSCLVIKSSWNHHEILSILYGWHLNPHLKKNMKSWISPLNHRELPFKETQRFRTLGSLGLNVRGLDGGRSASWNLVAESWTNLPHLHLWGAASGWVFWDFATGKTMKPLSMLVETKIMGNTCDVWDIWIPGTKIVDGDTTLRDYWYLNKLSFYTDEIPSLWEHEASDAAQTETWNWDELGKLWKV